MQPVRAKVPRRRGVCARVGVLEDVRGAAGGWVRVNAMRTLGNGLSTADQNEDALSVREAELAMLRRIGAPGRTLLGAQGNLATTYQKLGRFERPCGCCRMYTLDV